MLLPAILGCKGCIWLSQDMIRTADFENVRSAIEPHLEELFNAAEQEFAQGNRVYWAKDNLGLEEYGLVRLRIAQFEDDDGMTYEVLFAYGGARRSAGGYYYTPSGKLPLWAPRYGVVCSMHMDGHWYAFNTVNSETPPDPDRCPEDTQYQ